MVGVGERDEAGETGRGEMIEELLPVENRGERHLKIISRGVISIGFTVWKNIFLRNVIVVVGNGLLY